jgi:gas vesicle protein
MTETSERALGAEIKQQSSTLAESLADSVSNQARDIGEEALGRANSIGTKVKAAAENVRDSASDLLDTAKSVASDTGDKIKDVVVTQKDAGADRISGVASVIRRAADDLEQDIPLAAPYIRRAAEEINDFANALKTQSLNEIVTSIDDFAHRQPAAFLGIAAFAGFAAVRLLKAPVRAGDPS